MEISFKKKKLEKLAHDDRKREKELGKPMAKKLKSRLDAIWYYADTLEDLRNMPGNFHELTGDRKGQFACDLVGQNRLIFIPQNNPIPTDDDGRYIWSDITAIEVIEIEDYH